jgi:hypothetical protein
VRFTVMLAITSMIELKITRKARSFETAAKFAPLNSIDLIAATA